jgi:hypothetical protein
MELASMLAGERFTDRPRSVCPLIGAVLRTYNDATDDPRRQDLYRFAAEVVGTRGEYGLQRARALLALDEARRAREETPDRRRHHTAEPTPEDGPDLIAEYVVESMARRAYSRYRSRRFDDAGHERVLSLLERLIATGRSTALDALLGELVEEAAQPVEDRGGEEELLFGEFGHGGAEAGLEASAPVFDEGPSPFGEGCEDDAPVLVGAGALYEAVVGEPVEHLGDGGRPQVGGEGELACGHPVAVAQAEQQPELSVAELPRPVALPPAHPSHRGHRALERSAQLLSAAALVALAYDARRRGR